MHAIAFVLGAYTAAYKTLGVEEQPVLRDVPAARLARDYLEALGVLDDEERAV